VHELRAHVGGRVGAGQRSGRAAGSAHAVEQTPTALSKVSFEQRLNEQLPLELPFKDESGRAVKLGDYFGASRSC
jgi:hypothetical protein